LQCLDSACLSASTREKILLDATPEKRLLLFDPATLARGLLVCIKTIHSSIDAEKLLSQLIRLTLETFRGRSSRRQGNVHRLQLGLKRVGLLTQFLHCWIRIVEMGAANGAITLFSAVYSKKVDTLQSRYLVGDGSPILGAIHLHTVEKCYLLTD